MSALTFVLKLTPQQRIDCSPLTPDNLAGKSIADIGAIELMNGKQKLRADSVFDISFDISGENVSDVVIENSSNKLDFIGSGMTTGCITVHGNVGAYLGMQMQGGEITVNGNAGAFVASGLKAGLINVNGNVGDFLAGAIAGDKKGMLGGMVIVTGNAGDRAGDQMRRGTLLIEGNVGSYCGSRMLAGTIAVLGTIGNYAGYGMQRGTLLFSRTPVLHATIQDCGLHTLPFLNLMFKSFDSLPGDIAARFAKLNNNRVRRYAGDLANDGKGEILVFS